MENYASAIIANHWSTRPILEYIAYLRRLAQKTLTRSSRCIKHMCVLLLSVTQPCSLLIKRKTWTYWRVSKIISHVNLRCVAVGSPTDKFQMGKNGESSTISLVYEVGEREMI
ncbi:hypothetical protein Y032_0096g2939 [Ancylostoma ceylanicum]|uniref:Uncharacterized protein n=1 Tax=Ancylostoma ceylanicum TaxID=53326 RepID=A0A016TKA4_9BILA|nr:hypothetical protein Y032_0096g2939 [Ancylostoma ceylanicum]